MTNEEAIKELKTRYLTMSQCLDKEELHKANEALDLAIKALEQQLRDCKTCIHSDKGNCAYTEECHECMWESKYEQQPSEDCISRQEAIDAKRYTFGNDEFSLEAAYHDCKLVFDGITDDDSFQEADAGLVLYYANEIIYALQEALEGNGTNVPINDCISRQAVNTLVDELARAISDERCFIPRGRSTTAIMQDILDLPPVTPSYNLEPYSDKLWKNAYERGKADAEQTRWIPVSERLPEKEGNYITTVKSGGFYRVEGESIFEVYGDGITHWAVIGEVIAWMPKPEPYKAESDVQE